MSSSDDDHNSEVLMANDTITVCINECQKIYMNVMYESCTYLWFDVVDVDCFLTSSASHVDISSDLRSPMITSLTDTLFT